MNESYCMVQVQLFKQFTRLQTSAGIHGRT